MDPQQLAMMAQALMGGSGQPAGQAMQTGYGAMYGMPSTQQGGMLGTSPYQSVDPMKLQQGGGSMMSGGADPNQLQQPYQQYGIMGGGGGGAESR